MTLSEPTLAPPMAPSTVDMAQIFAAHAERAARIEALRPGNKDRLFDGLTAAGITHVTVTFDGAGDSGQIESIGAWSGETAVDFPATEIAYAAVTWDDPEVEMRQLSLEDVVEQLAYDFLSDTHGGWENNDGAWGEFCFDAAARGRCLGSQPQGSGWPCRHVGEHVEARQEAGLCGGTDEGPAAAAQCGDRHLQVARALLLRADRAKLVYPAEHRSVVRGQPSRRHCHRRGFAVYPGGADLS